MSIFRALVNSFVFRDLCSGVDDIHSGVEHRYNGG
jgi:hypothetical protein